MKNKSSLLGFIALLFISICGLSFGQAAPTSIPVQKLNVSHVTPDGYTATLALVQSPRFAYDPITATATATISVVFYKDASAITSHLRPADFKVYSLTTVQTSNALSPSAITQHGGTPINAAVVYLLTLPDFAGASVASQ